MILAHKIALDPNNVQETYFRKAAGAVDPALPNPSDAAPLRQLNAIKADQFPWMLEVAQNAP